MPTLLWCGGGQAGCAVSGNPGTQVLSGASRQETTDSGSGSSVCLVGQALLRDYVLDTRNASCYAFFVLETFSNLAMCFLMMRWPLCVNRCRIASSLVMFFGCFFF